MAERKEVIHYCIKCGKGMRYKEKKMLYMYDIETTSKFGLKREMPTKRFAINLCDKCADELQDLIADWHGKGGT